MFSVYELLAMCMLDGIIFLTSPRLEDTELLVPCDAKLLSYYISFWCNKSKCNNLSK